MIYVREAHPADGWNLTSNVRQGINIKQPSTDDERCTVAGRCQAKLDFSMPVLVDEINDRVGTAYSGMPERMYVIDRQGRVSYKGGRGPFHFNLGEFEQSLILLLNQIEQKPAKPAKAAKPAGQASAKKRKNARFPTLNNNEAWSRMPRPSLPVWARALSKPLPRATAGMLHLDYVHRAQNPLDPVIRGKIRWVAADANRCDYSRRYAEADLLRAGLTKADLAKLAGNHAGLPKAERELLTFARKMTLAAHTVTDDEFAAIMKRFGPEKTVAIVHTLAQANFQDRIFLALGIQVEPDGPYPPFDVPFDPAMKSAVAAPSRSPWKSVLSANLNPQRNGAKPHWSDYDFSGVQKLLAHQKGRKSRIPLPKWSVVSKKMPPELRRRGPSKVIWSNVSLGYQPQLTMAWFNCMRTFRAESNLDRVFANSMFWVVTRSNQCFY